MATKTVACPRCGALVEWVPASKFRPFCSERCKTRDLGAWANDEYRIGRELSEDELEMQEQGETRSS